MKRIALLSLIIVIFLAACKSSIRYYVVRTEGTVLTIATYDSYHIGELACGKDSTGYKHCGFVIDILQ